MQDKQKTKKVDSLSRQKAVDKKIEAPNNKMFLGASNKSLGNKN